jgi:hypothetical protein
VTREKVLGLVKYKISYRVGLNDLIHLDFVERVAGYPLQLLRLPFALDQDTTVFVEVRFDDQGVGFFVPSQIHTGLTWKLKVGMVDIILPTDAWVVVSHPTTRFRLSQLPLAQTGVLITIEAC